MVRKFTLQPDLVGLLNGAHRQARQGIARAGSALVVQEPHEAPEGESVIPSVDVVQVIEGVRERLAEMDIRIVDAGQYLPVSTSAPTAADAAPLGAIWRQVDAEGDVVAKWIMTADGWESFTGVVILAENVAASVGVFIDAMMENLTVTGAANINEAAIGELTTRIAEIIRINVEQLYVGRDIRFTPAGLVFYAPPSPGQDPEDWGTRVPLISLTPTGEVSVSVAQGGVITAGLTAQGGVWGKEGSFETLLVGGQDILARINAMPRGVLGITRASANIPLSYNARLTMAVRVKWDPTRILHVQPQLGMTRSTGRIRVRYFLAYGGTSGLDTQIEVASYTQAGDGDFNNPIWVQGTDHPTIPAGTEVAIALAIDLPDATNATGTLWSDAKVAAGAWLGVSDVGAVVTRWNQPATGDAIPTARDRTDTLVSAAGVPYRASGSVASSTTLAIAGQQIEPTDTTAGDYVFFPIDMLVLTGSTILSARVTFTRTAIHPQAGALVKYAIFASQGGFTNWIQVSGTGQTAKADAVGNRMYTIPTANLSRLIGKTGLLFGPSGSVPADTWQTLASTIRLEVTYRK